MKQMSVIRLVGGIVKVKIIFIKKAVLHSTMNANVTFF